MGKDSQGARGRRFAASMNRAAAALNASTPFDWRLLPHDVAGSIAHARMLGKQGIVSQDDADQIIAGLQTVAAEFADGSAELDPALEDVHMNVESRLIKHIGEAGARLHTARSRNDQVATDLRLYALSACVTLTRRIDDLRRALCDQAKQHVDTLAPGYTHLQRAQPVRLAHHFLAYAAMLERDRGRLTDAARRTSQLPLGSGALAATTFPIDRNAVADELGFAGVTRNSQDAVSDRDFAVEIVAAAALAQAHLSRLGEELVLWSSQEFGFVKLPEDFCSGSSIMPQKMNPDIPELVRAKTGRVFGDLMALLTVIKGLPLAYNKDLQETQEPLYDAVDTLAASLHVMAGVVSGMTIHKERVEQAGADGMLLCTELADYLVRKGVPFRRAHDVTGALVRTALDRGGSLSDLSLDDLKAAAPEFADDAKTCLDPQAAVDGRNVVGGPAKQQLLDEIARLDKDLQELSHAPL